MRVARAKSSFYGRLALATALMGSSLPSFAGWFNKNQPVPDWGMQAWKTKTPDYAKDAAAVIASAAASPESSSPSGP